MKPPAWTREEDDLLIEGIVTGIPVNRLAALLGRSPQAIRTHKTRLWSMPARPHDWTPEEDELLRAHHKENRPPALDRPLPDVYYRMWLLGLRLKGPASRTPSRNTRPRTYRTWTAAEVKRVLLDLQNGVPLTTIANNTGRTVTSIRSMRKAVRKRHQETT